MSNSGPGPVLGDSWRDEPGSWVDPQQVHVTRIDVPFLELTWFFIKSSLALALAFSVTSWLWVMIGTGIASLLAGLLYLVGVPQLVTGGGEVPAAALMAPTPAPPSPPADPEPAAEPPAAPAAEPAPPPVPAVADDGARTAPTRTGPGAPVDPNASATEALLREELERLRRERQ